MNLLENITDITKATIIYCEKENYTETRLQLEGEDIEEAHEIIIDLAGEIAVYPNNSFIRIDGIPFAFNDNDIRNTLELNDVSFFEY